jgi:shikimate kinase
MAPRLILTGFMATGKSAVAAIVARRLGWPLIDTDQRLVARAGKPVAAIFSEDGEPHFRRLEREVISEIACDRCRCALCKRQRPAVVSTGGGALVDEANYRALSATGVIICLSARPEVIARRVEKSRTERPKLLEGAKPLSERIEELLAERRGAYARADVTVDTSDITVEEVAERVLAAFVRLGARRCARSA